MTEGDVIGPEERCRREVGELHRFFEDWFCGRVPKSRESFGRFRHAMAEGFRIVDPSGRTRELRQLEASLWEAHGCRGSADDFIRIRVERIDSRSLPGGGGICLVTYDEWHETPEGERGRRSSALLRPITVADRDGREGGTGSGDREPVEWLHVHETWLPPAEDA